MSKSNGSCLKNKFPKKHKINGETVYIGKYSHSCGKLIICKLECQNIPFPNSFVLVNKKTIGKINEIFGTLDDKYCSIETDHDNLHKIGQEFECYKDKFIYPERLLSREETLIQKEKEDKIKKDKEKKRGHKIPKKVRFAKLKKSK